MAEINLKQKSEGVKHCCYGTCKSDTRYRHRDGMKDVFFIPFPKPITKREMCERWIKACGRPGDDFNINKIKRCTYICSKHFVGGKGPTAEHPDPIPALLHTDEQVRRFQRKRKAPTPRSKPQKASRADVQIAAESLIELSNLEPLQMPQDLDRTPAFESPVQDKCTQTDRRPSRDADSQTVYQNEFLGAKIENMILRNNAKLADTDVDLSKIESSTSAILSLNSIKHDDSKMKLFTSLYYCQFLALFNFLGDSVHNLTYWDGEKTKEKSKPGQRKLLPEEELFLTLVRLKRGYSLKSLSHFFGISSSTISTIFSTWIQLLYHHFNDYRLDMFPGRQHFKDNLPQVFKTFKNIRCTIDCTEFFVQMPRDFKRQGNLYSSYKNHHTYKSLVAVAPNGSIVFVSDLFEGSISDRAIVEKSGFLDFINPGDMILADRGFLIEDLLLTRQAALNIPPFLGKRKQFTAQEELKTRRIAKARIHVERVIERIKKFQLLSSKIPLTLAPIADQLVFVASCLVNFQEPLVK